MSNLTRLNGFNENQLASYLFYHAFLVSSSTEYRYHTVMSKEKCDQYNEEFENENNISGRPVNLNSEAVKSWYPKTFSERIDLILLYLSSHTKHIGQSLTLSYEGALSLLFVDRKENQERTSYLSGNDKRIRKREECHDEVQYILDYLSGNALIGFSFEEVDDENYVKLKLLPQGYQRVDIIQKNTSYGRSALVAMRFADETMPLREAIRDGISNAGYHAVFIDEVQHNDFITPELLKHIRDSRFVVVDLTHQNNGAYFEEGYAMGLGKVVIQLCKKGTILHFDIAQKNTIIWENEDAIPERLSNRIRASID